MRSVQKWKRLTKSFGIFQQTPSSRDASASKKILSILFSCAFQYYLLIYPANVPHWMKLYKYLAWLRLWRLVSCWGTFISPPAKLPCLIFIFQNNQLHFCVRQFSLIIFLPLLQDKDKLDENSQKKIQSGETYYCCS